MPEIEELPALTTNMGPNEFAEWLSRDETIYVVYLPDRRTFITKVPNEHLTFFVSMMEQLRMVLGPEVRALKTQVVSTAPPSGELPDPVEFRRCGGSRHRPQAIIHKPTNHTPGRGTCSGCGFEFKLRWDGTVRSHKLKNHAE